MSLGVGLVGVVEEFLHRNKDLVEDGVCKISASSWEVQAKAHNASHETKDLKEEISKARCIVPKFVTWAEIITSDEERIQVSPIIVVNQHIFCNGFDYILFYPMARNRTVIWSTDWKENLCSTYQIRHSV